MSGYLHAETLRIDCKPGAFISVETSGEYLDLNPHIYAMVKDGIFKPDGSPWLLFDDRRDLFQLKKLVTRSSQSQMLQKLSSDTDEVLMQHDFAFDSWENTIRNLGLVDEWNKCQAYFKSAPI